jgi:hypothetical protein
MLQLTLEDKDCEDGSYVPQWGEGDEFVVTVQNPPHTLGDSINVLEVLPKLDGVAQAARREAALTVPTELSTKMGRLPACVLSTLCPAPSGERYFARIGFDGCLGAANEIVNCDGGSQVSLVSPTTAARLMKLGLAKRLAHKSLLDTFSAVVSARGQPMDHGYDLSLCVHPLGADGKPLERGFPVVVHVVSDFQGEGVLIGIQQHLLWQLETSFKTGMKTITSDGTEYTFPYSIKSDDTLFVPGTANAITRVITEVEPPSNVKKNSARARSKNDTTSAKVDITPNPS